MSTTPAARPRSSVGPPPGGATAGRRVRHQAQDVVALMAFSGFTSLGCALALLLITQLGR